MPRPFYVYCPRTSCSAVGPIRNNGELAVIAWNHMTQAFKAHEEGRSRPTIPLQQYKDFLIASDLNFIEKGWSNHRTGEGHVSLVVSPDTLGLIGQTDGLYWDGEETGVRFRFDIQTGKLLAIGTGGD